MKYILSSLIAIFILLINNKTFSQKRATTDTVKQEKKDPWQSTFSGLKFRSIGPALVSGRIVDLAVNPKNTSEYYVASANGGVWKTTNAGVTYTQQNGSANSVGAQLCNRR